MLTATDVTGATSTPAVVTFTVPAPTPPPAPPTTPADTTAPKVTISKLTTSLPKLLARKALTAKFRLNERATVSASLVATVTLPPIRKGKPVRKYTVVLASTKAKLLQPGARSVKLTPTKAAIKRFKSLTAKRGVRVTRYDLKLVAADAATNTARPSLKVTVTKR